LQHTATHCNTLQHTATHCNSSNALQPNSTLQHTATHCNTQQQSIEWRAIFADGKEKTFDKFPCPLVDEHFLALVDFGSVALSVESIKDDHTEYMRPKRIFLSRQERGDLRRNSQKWVMYLLYTVNFVASWLFENFLLVGRSAHIYRRAGNSQKVSLPLNRLCRITTLMTLEDFPVREFCARQRQRGHGTHPPMSRKFSKVSSPRHWLCTITT